MSAESENKFDRAAKDLRTQIQSLATDVRGELGYLAQNLEDGDVYDRVELHANITLAYRHLEDARMRLGKAIQARDGGKSVYKE